MIIRNSIASPAFIGVDDESVNMSSGAMSISCDKTSGNFINGPVSLTTGLSNIRFGGVFKFNPLAASCVPSTIVTPISTFIIDVPAKNIAGLAKCAAIVMSTIGKFKWTGVKLAQM